MPQLRFAFPFVLALIAFAEEPPKGAAAQPAAVGFRRLLASIQQNGREYEVVVEGEGNLPDSAVIDVSLEHRGQPCEELRGSVSPKDGIFSMRMSTSKAFCPGYYVVVALVSPWRQTGELAGIVEKAGEIRVTQAITLGSPEEIKACRDEQLRLYEGQIEEMSAEYEKLSRVYAKAIEKAADPAAEMEAWKKDSAAIPDECRAKAQRLNELFQDKVIPVFPLLHSWTVNGWMNLVKIHDSLEEGLTVDQRALAGHGETQAVFERKGREQLDGYVRGMRAQVLLERHLEVRDKVLNVLTELASLYDESRTVFRQVKELHTPAIQDFWTQTSAAWDKRIAEVERALPQIKTRELDQDYPDVVARISETPGGLRKLWKLYSQVVLGEAKTPSVPGHGGDGLVNELESTELECWARIYPLMEVLGFNRDVFNRQMNRTAEVAEVAEPSQLVSGAIDEYILGQTEKLASDDETVRNQALQAILGMKAASLRVLKKRLEGGVEPGSRMEGLLLVCLGRLGEASVAGRLVALAEKGQDESLRVSATLAAGSTRSMEALEPLTRLLKGDASAAERAAAATALSFLGDPAALDAVIGAFMDGDLAVRQSAHAAASALAKNEFQFDPKAPARTRQAQTDAAKGWLEQNRSKLQGGGK